MGRAPAAGSAPDLLQNSLQQVPGGGSSGCIRLQAAAQELGKRQGDGAPAG